MVEYYRSKAPSSEEWIAKGIISKISIEVNEIPFALDSLVSLYEDGYRVVNRMKMTHERLCSDYSKFISTLKPKLVEGSGVSEALEPAIRALSDAEIFAAELHKDAAQYVSHQDNAVKAIAQYVSTHSEFKDVSKEQAPDFNFLFKILGLSFNKTERIDVETIDESWKNDNIASACLSKMYDLIPVMMIDTDNALKQYSEFRETAEKSKESAFAAYRNSMDRFSKQELEDIYPGMFMNFGKKGGASLVMDLLKENSKQFFDNAELYQLLRAESFLKKLGGLQELFSKELMMEGGRLPENIAVFPMKHVTRTNRR